MVFDVFDTFSSITLELLVSFKIWLFHMKERHENYQNQFGLIL